MGYYLYYVYAKRIVEKWKNMGKPDKSRAEKKSTKKFYSN